jgi:hypothetical protein
MKKIFTLIAMGLMALGVQAETMINYPTAQNGIAVSGTTTFDAVKIKTNTTSIPGIKFANSYTTSEALNENYAKLTVEGGFKAGDVVSIAGAFNNSDDTKKSAVDLFTVDADNAITVIFTTQQFINGRTSDADPTVETYTLQADADALYLGRNGHTGTIVTLLKVVRGGTTAIENIQVQQVDGVVYNLAGQPDYYRIAKNSFNFNTNSWGKAISFRTSKWLSSETINIALAAKAQSTNLSSSWAPLSAVPKSIHFLCCLLGIIVRNNLAQFIHLLHIFHSS